MRFLATRSRTLATAAVACTLLLVGSGEVEAAPSGLVAAYSFNAGSGSSVVDDSGSNNAGTVSGATWSSAGKYGHALLFDGVNDLVTIPSSSSIDLKGRMTLEAWVQPNALGSTWRSVLVKERPNSLNYALYAHTGGGGPSGRVYVRSRDRYSPGGPIAANAWSHLAATYDGSALRLYVNGVVVTSLAVSGPIARSTNPLRIGGNSIWGEWFSGLIDEVRIYNRALTAAEIRSDMTTPLAGGTPADTQAPTTPATLTVSGASQTSITVGWTASTDNLGVTGYGRYRDGSLVTNGTGTSYTFAGLTCGTSYTLAVDAYDAAGNRSAAVQTSAATSACTSGDTQAPTMPASLRTTGATQTSVSVAWNASSDNVGVSGYGYYRGAGLIGNGTGTSYTFAGLACGTSYAVAVDAYDAAGNRSAKAQLSASTAACSSPTAASGPANLWVDTSGGSCTRQASEGAYNDAQACASFAAAYTSAASGDTVRVRAGSYGAQNFAGGVGSSQGSGTKTLTFVGEPGNLIRQLHFSSSNLTFDGIHVDASGTKTSGAAFENGGDSFVFKNGSIGNVADEKGAMISGPNMVFDNVLFHDVVLRTSGVHLECIMALWNQGMVIRNSTFRNCGIMSASIGIGDWWQPPPPPYTSVTLENNYWGTSRTNGGSCCAAYTLALWATQMPLGSDYGVLSNWRIVGNHFEPGSGVIVRPRDDGTSVICGNTGSVPSSSWASTCP